MVLRSYVGAKSCWEVRNWDQAPLRREQIHVTIWNFMFSGPTILMHDLPNGDAYMQVLWAAERAGQWTTPPADSTTIAVCLLTQPHDLWRTNNCCGAHPSVRGLALMSAPRCESEARLVEWPSPLCEESSKNPAKGGRPRFAPRPTCLPIRRRRQNIKFFLPTLLVYCEETG